MKILSFFLSLTLLLTPVSHSWAGENFPFEKFDAWEGRSQTAQHWFFKDLPRHIGNDIKETFGNPWHLAAMGVGIVATVGVHTKDRNIQSHFDGHQAFGKGFDDAMNVLGSPFLLGGTTLGVLGLSKILHSEKTALVSGTMLEAFLLSEGMTAILKVATRRERPDGSSKGSFPSAHTSGAFALASVAEVYYGPWVGLPSYGLATVIGFSRMDASKHWASDVLAGAVIGTMIGIGTAKFHKKEFSNVFITPVVSEDQAGLSLTYIFP